MKYIFFAKTAKILALSLANFYWQLISRQTHQLIIFEIIYCKNKLTSVFRACPAIDIEFRHNIVKLVCGNVMMESVINYRTDA